MNLNKKEMMEKQRKSLFVKDIVTKNPIFSKEHIEEFYAMFSLYCDAKRQCDISEILNTAKTLGFDRKYPVVFEAIHGVVEQLDGAWINFQTFLSLLTDKIGNPFNQKGRKAMFRLLDGEDKQILNFYDLVRISEQMKYNLSEEEIQDVINNVAGFGRSEITWQQFNKYINKKVEKKNLI